MIPKLSDLKWTPRVDKNAWAPGIVERDGRYYFYFSADSRIGVAVADYRHSAQDRQENSIPIQRDQVRDWADKNGLDIIREFADPGKSGLTAEGRPAFTEIMDEWVKHRDGFDYVLCLDVTRSGRFQDIDLSAVYSAHCNTHEMNLNP